MTLDMADGFFHTIAVGPITHASEAVVPKMWSTRERKHLLRTGSLPNEHYFDNVGGSGKTCAPESQIIA